jgi:hypothetical protein
MSELKSTVSLSKCGGYYIKIFRRRWNNVTKRAI